MQREQRMTGEEMERAIEFLLQSQANFEERLVAFEAQQRRTDEQIAETGRQIAETGRQVAETERQVAETERQLAAYAETQSVFIQTVTRTFEAQDQINASLRVANAQADERLNKLIRLFEQHIVAGH
jgi:septal ring factor EnvC (AmiA/AmiB activator)